MTPNIVAGEAFAVPHVLGSFSRREIDPVYLHSIGVPVRTCHPWLGLLDVAVSSSSELPESYHISMELPGFIQPLLPFHPVFSWPMGRAVAVIIVANWLVTPPWRVSTRMLLALILLCTWARWKAVENWSKSPLNWSIVREYVVCQA